MKYKLLGRIYHNGADIYLVSSESKIYRLSKAEFIYNLGRKNISNAIGKLAGNTVAIKLLDRGKIVDINSIPKYDDTIFKVVGRYEKCGVTIGYKLTNLVREINLSLDDTVKLIKKGKVDNAKLDNNEQIETEGELPLIGNL